MKHLIVYTDGGCAKNPYGKGGYGAIIIYEDGNIIELTDGFKVTTNNRMEIMGFIAVLEKIKCESYIIDLYSDSKYLLNCLKGLWKRTKNLDLWAIIDKYLKASHHIIHYNFVKGHSGNIWNNRCDELVKISYNKRNEELKKDLIN